MQKCIHFFETELLSLSCGIGKKPKIEGIKYDYRSCLFEVLDGLDYFGENFLSI